MSKSLLVRKIRKKRSEWFFYNEIYAELIGPFKTKEEAEKELKWYRKYLNRIK